MVHEKSEARSNVNPASVQSTEFSSACTPSADFISRGNVYRSGSRRTTCCQLVCWTTKSTTSRWRLRYGEDITLCACNGSCGSVTGMWYKGLGVGRSLIDETWKRLSCSSRRSDMFTRIIFWTSQDWSLHSASVFWAYHCAMRRLQNCSENENQVLGESCRKLWFEATIDIHQLINVG